MVHRMNNNRTLKEKQKIMSLPISVFQGGGEYECMSSICMTRYVQSLIIETLRN